MTRMQWSFDSVVLAAVAVDLEPLIAAAVTRVLQPARDEIVLALGRRRGGSHVVLSIHPRWARVHVTGEPEPGVAASFCQLLRARLEGARLTRIDQPPFERTLTLGFEALDERIDLVAEVMGRHSNLVAVSGGTILGALKPVTASMSSVRQILPGRAYAPPPRDRPGPSDLTPAALRDALARSTGGPLPRRLSRAVLGVSPLLATELAARAGLVSPARERSADEEAAALWPAIGELIAMLTSRQFSPTLYRSGDGPVGFTPWPYVHLDGLAAERTRTMSEAVATVAATAAVGARLEEQRARLRAVLVSAVGRAAQTQVQLRLAMDEAVSAEELRRHGDLLFAYAAQIPARARSATLPGFDGRPVTIALDPALTPVENARRLFARYARVKAARPDIERRLGEVAALVEYLENALALVDTASADADLAAIRAELADEGLIKRPAPGRTARPEATGPRAYVASSGHEIIAGRTNRENDEVTFTLARPDDVWLHARGMPGAHVIIRSRGSGIPDRTVREAAEIAAYFSRGRAERKVPVSYTLRKHVKKPRGARPGLVTITHEKTVTVEPRRPEPTGTRDRGIARSRE